MKRTLLAILLTGALTAFASRIDDIAAHLPPAPKADGDRITNRAAWQRIGATAEGVATLKAAENVLRAPVPDTPDALYLQFTQNGNRRNYENCLFRRTGNFSCLVMAECIEAKGRFIPKICEYVDAFAAMKSWVLPAHDGGLECFKGVLPHVDLFSSAITLDLAFAYDWLGSSLPAATRAKIYSECNRRTFQPHLDHCHGKVKQRYHWWFHGGNNWNSVCNCNVVRAALAMVKDRRARAEFVALAEESVPYAIAGYTNDGYCSEGVGYWNYGYGHHLMMGLSVRNATGGYVNFFADPKTKQIMEYAYGFQLEPGVSPFFADGGGNPSAAVLALGRQVWPDLANTTALAASPSMGGAPYISLRAFGQEPPKGRATMDVLPIRSWFPDAQVLLSRSTATARRLSVAIKGGHNNELHNHNDVGSYYLLLDGVNLVGDPGGEVYTRRTFSRERYVSKVLNSYGHPVPVIGGKLQSGGQKACAKVVSTDFRPQRDVVVLDCTAAYAVPTLKSLVRTMVNDRQAGTVTITDKAVFSAPTAFEVPVITYHEWKGDASGLHFTFDGVKGRGAATFIVKASASVKHSVEKIENPGRASPIRHAFAFEQPVREAVISTTFKSR